MVPGMDVAGRSPRHLENCGETTDERAFPAASCRSIPSRSRFERLYARILGAPANGLRIRLRRVLPATDGTYRDILDAGCGSGVFSFELAKRHPDGAGARDRAVILSSSTGPTRSRAGPDLTNCRFEQGDVTRLEFDAEFDLVVSVDNFEHVEDDVTAMATLLTGPPSRRTPGRPRPGLRAALVRLRSPGELRRPRPRATRLPGATSFVGKLRDAGFEVERHSYTYGVIETFTNNISYSITGADQRRKVLYALAFPLLLAVSYLGKCSRPRWGAGVLAVARRPASGRQRRDAV